MTTLAFRSVKQAVRVNDEEIVVEPRETILQAALRQGVDIPHSCRVGACGTCKCRLVSGRVHELTETGYLLSADEIEAGTILACQSVPLEKVSLTFESPIESRKSCGTILKQERLTGDITKLTIQTDASIPYRAGQFARLELVALPGVIRNYSFACSPNKKGRIEFFVRSVPGGIFSNFVRERDLVGESLSVEGPFGEFHLEAGDRSILMLAGGSGLAPLLAMLEEALESEDARSITLLLGVRTSNDLFALDRIEEIGKRWHGTFTFVPVLSEEKLDSGWAGKRGFLSEVLAKMDVKECDVYLCGPPPMIDSTARVLSNKGVDSSRVFIDRFTTQADLSKTMPKATPVERPASRSKATLLDYAKYFLFHAISLLSVTAILAGGSWITVGLLAIVVLYMLGDALLGDDTSAPEFSSPSVLTLQLWLALPLLGFIVFSSVWSVCPGDPLGYGAWLTSWTGYDVVAARDATHWGHHISTAIMTGLMIGLVGTITGHELTHRTWDRVSMAVGRWLLSFSFDTIFSIEHVYGHHRYVSSDKDPATAPRGRNVYYHVLASTIKGNLSAWEIEVERLHKKRRPVFSWHNAWIRGHLMSALLVAFAFAMGGWKAALFFISCALWGKALLEIVNYMEHYGMVRNPRTPVQPRHSWNTNRRLSSWTMFNLTRHSHHHAQGEVPYQDLMPCPDAPMMINGYLTTIIVALVPPLWHRLMIPKLLDWDRRYASDEERELARVANLRSRLKPLMEASSHT